MINDIKWCWSVGDERLQSGSWVCIEVLDTSANTVWEVERGKGLTALAGGFGFVVCLFLR